MPCTVSHPVALGEVYSLPEELFNSNENPLTRIRVDDQHEFSTMCSIGILVNNTVKPEITHTLGEHQILWVITGYGLLQV